MKKSKNILSVAVLSALVGLSSSSLAFAQSSDIENLQKDMPKNWGKWGENDQIGALKCYFPLLHRNY